MNITKSAPLPERPCEQLTCCEKNGSVQGNYINRVAKRHNCRITGKTKATGGGRQWENTKHKPEHHSDLLAGGQCDQCAGLLVGYQPFGSIPRRFSSALANSLNQLPRVRPSEVAASFTCWRSSLLILIWKVGDHPSPRGDLSRFNVDMYVRNSYYHCCYVRTISVGTVKSKAPQVSLPLAGLLTTNDNESIEVAMLNHTTHPQGRDSHNLNKYIWRFIALSTAQPRVITIEATSEQEARQQSPAGCVMIFAARIRQGVHHVQ
ncbi:host cell division inhibitor Icd-like protein [Escherichia coli]|nr:host cell division inhibitor Icd-like protein [Escherichia coli]ELK2901796.1 host cell division inhibitor Icd-like protein [Escherichia coli]